MGRDREAETGGMGPGHALNNMGRARVIEKCLVPSRARGQPKLHSKAEDYDKLLSTTNLFLTFIADSYPKLSQKYVNYYCKVYIVHR